MNPQQIGRQALRSSLTGLLLTLSLGSAPQLLTAATPRQTSSKTSVPDSVGIVIVAHGATPGWNARIDSIAAAVRRGGEVRGPVRVAFLMGEGAPQRRFQDAVAELAKSGARRVVVVPLLVSSHSGHYEQIRFLARTTDSLDAEMEHHLHMAGISRAAADIRVAVTPAIDAAPEIAEVVAERALKLVPDTKGRALLLFGHGPNSAEDYAAWMGNLRIVAEAVRVKTGFASVVVELVRDDAPAAVRAEAVLRTRELITLQRAATGKDVAVVPLLVSSGDVGQRKLPADLAGLPIIYDGEPMAPHNAIAKWVARSANEALKTTFK